MPIPSTDEERIAKRFHEVYEMLSPDYGYETRRESAVKWEQVPANNRALMTATVKRLLDENSIIAGTF